MAVEVTHGVAGAALPCRRQRLALVDDLGQFFGQVVVLEVRHRPAGGAQDAPCLSVHDHPAAVHEGQLLPCFAGDGSQPFHRAFLEHLAGRGQVDLLRTAGHPPDPEGLLAHEECVVALPEKGVVHAVSPGMVCRHLLHIPEQSAGLQAAAEVAVAVQHGHLLRIASVFTHILSLSYKKGLYASAQPPQVQYILRVFLRTLRQILKQARASIAASSIRNRYPLPPSS